MTVQPTEEQIRAVLAVEHFTDMEPGYICAIRVERQALGGVFAWGNFWTGSVLIGRQEQRGRIDFHVVERDTGLILGHAHATRADALAEARELLLAMGQPMFLKMLADRKSKRTPVVVPQGVQRCAKQPRKISKRARAVFASSDGRCHYCGAELVLEGNWEIEHKVPRALFGGSEQSNLVASCRPCNRAKRDRTDLEFKALKGAHAAPRHA